MNGSMKFTPLDPRGMPHGIDSHYSMSDSSGNTLQTPKNEVITSAIVQLRDDNMYRQRVWRKWLPGETWDAVLTLYGLIDGRLFTVYATKFNAAMIRSNRLFGGPSMESFDGTNQSGISCVRFIKTFYHLVTDPFDQADYPCPLDTIWKDRVASAAADVLMSSAPRIVITRSLSMTSLFSAMTFKDKLQTATPDEALSRTSEEDTTSTAEQHFNEAASSCASSPPESMTTTGCAGAFPPSTTCTSTAHCLQQEEAEQYHDGRLLPNALVLPEVQDGTEAMELHNQAGSSFMYYWNSRDAWNLFAGGGNTSFEQFSANGGGDTVFDILEGHVTVMQSVNKTVNG